MQCVLGIVPLQNAQAVIDNLVEQEFSEKSISLLATDMKRARSIIDDGGPLQGVSLQKLPAFLSQYHVSPNSYTDAISKGYAIIAIHCSNKTCDAIKETLVDNSAQDIIVVH